MNYVKNYVSRYVRCMKTSPALSMNYVKNYERSCMRDYVNYVRETQR